jgi:cell division protein FtsL
MEGMPRAVRTLSLILVLQLIALAVGFLLMYRTQLAIVQQLDDIRQEMRTTNQHMSDLKTGLQRLVPGMGL